MTVIDRFIGSRLSLLFLAIGGLAAGLLLFMPFAGFWVSLVAYVPFYLILMCEMKRGARILNLFVYGFFFFLPNIYWIYRFTVLGIFLVILYLILAVALLIPVARLLKRFHGGVFLLPGIWALIEWGKGTGALGYPWNEPGNAVVTFLPAASAAQWGGVHLLTLVILMINFLVAKAFIERHKGYIRAAAVLLTALLLSHFAAPGPLINGQRVRVALIQPSIDLYAKWDEAFIMNNMEIYKGLASRVSAETDLVIWPETAFSSGILWYEPEKKALVDIIKSQKGSSAHLVGSTHYDRSGVYNSLFLIDHTGSYTRYDKIQLLPVAEFLPFPKLTSFLMDLYPIQYTLTRGTRTEPFEIGPFRFTGVICFESIFSGFVNALMGEGSEFLVVSTNDGWFEGTPAPLHHLQMTRLRAIEQQSYVAQCANSGISAIIDNTGRVVRKTGMRQRTVLEGALYPRKKPSFYARHGQLLFLVSLFLSFFLPLFPVMIRKKRRRE